MKITGSQGIAAPAPAVSAEALASPAPSAVSAAETPLQSAGLQKAQAELAALPEIDQARVAALKDALARGELPFDASKLAGLIERYHGGRS